MLRLRNNSLVWENTVIRISHFLIELILFIFTFCLSEIFYKIEKVNNFKSRVWNPYFSFSSYLSTLYKQRKE